MDIGDILALQKATQMNQQQAVPPVPTEKSQIVVVYDSNPGCPIIFRFGTLKKGRAEYKKMCKAWEDWKAGERSEPLHQVDADMFVGTIDISVVAGICFADMDVRNKFVPIP